MGKELRGILCALATPFTSDGWEVDESVLRSLVDGMIDAGIHGLIPGGSTGEFAVLSMAERRRIAEVVMEQTKGRVPVVPHTGSCSTADAIELSRHAEGIGADAVMVVQPYYEPTSLDELYGYFEDVSNAIDIPMMIYNNPAGTGMNPSPEFVGRVVHGVKNVRYVKDSSGDLSQISELLYRYGSEAGILNGTDTITFSSLALGCPGAVWGTANVIPRQCATLFNLTEAGEWVEAKALWDRIWPVNQFIVSEGFLASVKAGANLVGFRVGDPRPPYRPLSAEKTGELRQLLVQAGSLES